MEERGNNLKAYFTDDDGINLLSDGKLQTEDGCVFYIHKYVLATKNKYFYALLCGMGKDKNDFMIPGVKGEVLSNILSYIYSGDIHITNENIRELMIASDYLLVDGILTELKTFMKNNLSIYNCIPFLVAALTINREDFAKESYRFVQTNFERVVYGERIDILDLPLGAFEQLLSDRNLCIRSEMLVFFSIVKWVYFNSSSRLPLVPHLIKYLMLSGIDEDSATEILQHDIVAKNVSFLHVNNIKSSFSSSLEVIKSYIQSSPKPESLPIKRIPPKLNLAFANIRGSDFRTQIYLTYDEQIDLWRKISDVYLVSHQFSFLINDSIYMFITNERNRRSNSRYNIIDRQLQEFSDFLTARLHYVVVNLEGNIYALGGNSYTGDEIYSVEIYDSNLNVWHPTASMIPISTFAAASLNNHIYVVGERSSDGGNEMIAQVFDASTETWSLMPALPTERSNAAVVSHLDKIYVIGGQNAAENLKVVEAFDPARNEWRLETSLPYAYAYPNAKVFQDLIIVFDEYMFSAKPPVFYNYKEEQWECFKESSPFNDIFSFQFFTIDKEEYIDIFTRENRHPDMHFIKSPFA